MIVPIMNALRFVVLPVVCLILDRPLGPALTLAWGTWAACASVAVAIGWGYLFRGLPSVFGGDTPAFHAAQEKRRSEIERDGLPWWMCAIGKVLAVLNATALGLALLYGGMP